MSKLMVILDGFENKDYKLCKSLQHIPFAGKKNNTPIGMAANSLNCILDILGVKKENIPIGRAYLESISLGIPILDTDLIFRCNYIELDKKKFLVSTCKINNEKKLKINNEKMQLINIGGHKSILIIKNQAHKINNIKTFPPHQNIGANISKIMPTGDIELQSMLCNLIYEYEIFPWGQSIKEYLPTFKSIHKKDGAMVAKTEIVTGIGKAMDMHLEKLNYATGDVDTNLNEKAVKAVALCEKYEYVLLHINGADESSHRMDKTQKNNFIKRVDSQVISYLLKNAKKNCEIVITADHETSVLSGMHINSEVYYYTINSSGNKKKH